MTRRIPILLALALPALALVAGIPALASAPASPAPQASPIHPDFPLLDKEGENVLTSGAPVSTLRTCGGCHDTAFISDHSGHADAGLSRLGEPADRPWDLGPGWFGRWNPLVYRALGGQGSTFDLGLAEWIQTYGARHVGGGPAVATADGTPLTDLPIRVESFETAVLDPATGEATAWDWSRSGGVEMNCFLCHLAQPDNDARLQALRDGRFSWAATATLLASGVLRRQGDGYAWIEQAFDAEGNVRSQALGVQDPADENCGLCHGLVYDDLSGPLSVTGCSAERYRTVTTGQIFSAQRLSESGMNLAAKETLTRSWDVHAERLLSCTDCHYSLNNPVYELRLDPQAPAHLVFDPRRIELGEYLKQPVHDFAQGGSAAEPATMRTCDVCHSLTEGHEWLPYPDRHAQALACETCHIPRLYSNALETVDWTVLTPAGEPRTVCRGLQGDPDSTTALVAGFEPAILPIETAEGGSRLAPFNLVTAWFWVYGDPPRPVRQADLKAAWFDGGHYSADILAVFDGDRDGALADGELVIDTPEKQSALVSRLTALGLENPRILGEVQPYPIHHDVASAEWAIRDCQTCHSDNSALARPMVLSSSSPGGVAPSLVADGVAKVSGAIQADASGLVLFAPDPAAEGVYVFGRDAVAWIDRLGGLGFLGVLVGISAHGGLRWLGSRRRDRSRVESDEVYMYGMYERLWHWLQTFTISALLLTGLIIHRPETFGMFSFRHAVLVHNILAVVLAVNAGLSLFYHLASGEIRQYLPRPAGFFHQAILQARYYLRGIFRREPHPFHKQPGRKLNPLQQITYLAILNVLLPLQGITGVLMWGVQRWPELAGFLGGLPVLAPVHSLVAWLFASFIVLHVYLTTTGKAPLTSLKAMTLGWEPIEPAGIVEGGTR